MIEGSKVHRIVQSIMMALPKRAHTKIGNAVVKGQEKKDLATPRTMSVRMANRGRMRRSRANHAGGDAACPSPMDFPWNAACKMVALSNACCKLTD